MVRSHSLGTKGGPGQGEQGHNWGQSCSSSPKSYWAFAFLCDSFAPRASQCLPWHRNLLGHWHSLSRGPVPPWSAGLAHALCRGTPGPHSNSGLHPGKGCSGVESQTSVQPCCGLMCSPRVMLTGLREKSRGQLGILGLCLLILQWDRSGMTHPACFPSLHCCLQHWNYGLSTKCRKSPLSLLLSACS